MSNGPKEVISPFVLRALACDMEEMQSPQAWADRCRAAAAEIEKLRAQNERLATSNHAYLSNYQEAADEIEKLREALRAVMCWIDGWEPAFLEDEEWYETNMLVQEALGEKE